MPRTHHPCQETFAFDMFFIVFGFTPSGKLNGSFIVTLTTQITVTVLAPKRAVGVAKAPQSYILTVKASRAVLAAL